GCTAGVAGVRRRLSGYLANQVNAQTRSTILKYLDAFYPEKESLPAFGLRTSPCLTLSGKTGASSDSVRPPALPSGTRGTHGFSPASAARETMPSRERGRIPNRAARAAAPLL